MANPLTIVTLVGAIIFGIWWFTGGGCKGDGKLAGPNSALCFDASSIGIKLPGSDAATDVDAPIDDPDIDPAGGGSDAEIQRLDKARKKLVDEGSTGDRYPDGRPLPITPAAKKSSLAHAFAAGIEDQITIA